MKLAVKAITLHQPWATLIIGGHKRFETRNWGTRYSGLLVIHAGKTMDVDPTNYRFMSHLAACGIGDYRKVPMGAALGVVWLNKCFKGQSVMPFIDEREQAFGWFDADDRVAWELTQPVAFEQPITMQGKQGLWDYPLALPDGVLEQFADFLHRED